jgi:hypothetical protein
VTGKDVRYNFGTTKGEENGLVIPKKQDFLWVECFRGTEEEE